jgi:penicillin-binding protein 1A
MATRPAGVRLAAWGVCALVTASCAQLEDLPRLTRRDLSAPRTQAQTSRIYDGDGHLVTTLHGRENRTAIPLRRIPKHVRKAVVAIEDQRFYKHNGVDFRAVARALVENVKSGRISEGGSTITQQYVKNVIIAPGATAERTLQRKLDEAILARQLEKKLSKREILERYLNTVYFGEGTYGIQAAAKTYFGVFASRLTLSQGATLAGLVRSPESYNPIDYPRRALVRRDLVLRQLDRLGWIRHRHVRLARSKGLQLDPAPDKPRYPAPYFVDYVKRLVTYDPRFSSLGPPEERQEALFQGGLRIYTTIDLEIQKAAEAAVKGVLYSPSDPYGSLVALDPKTGHVKAMVGGRDFFAPKRKEQYAKLNLATMLEPGLGPRNEGGNGPGSGRQAGSAFKPFALAAAIAEGVPLSKSYNASGSCITLANADNGAPYTPCNYEGSAYGKISLLEATVKSVNTVFALLGDEIGAQAVVDTARRMGIRTSLEPVASAPLGTNVVNPLDMASAYGTLAASGMRHPPVAVRKIVGPSGRVLYRDETKGRQVVSPVTAYLTTSALEQVILRGTATAANIGRPAAGKTGTAQEYRDAWFVGYTPDLVASVWVGYPGGQIEMKTDCTTSVKPCRPTRIQVTGGSWPAEIWQAFMLRALARTPPSDFPVPDAGVTTVTIDTRNGCLAGPFTPAEDQSVAVFATGTAPTQSCLEPGDRILVPGVQGLSVEAAIELLAGRGLGVAIDRQPTPDVTPGTVIGQSPAGGTPVAQGTTVGLAVASRPEPEETPKPQESPSPKNDNEESPSPDEEGGGNSGGGGGGNSGGQGNGNSDGGGDGNSGDGGGDG